MIGMRVPRGINMKEEILNYMEYLFSLALKKSENLADAEDLTSEVLLAALAYMERGGVIANMKSWLSSTLNHKWNDSLRKKYKFPAVSIDAVAHQLAEEITPDDDTAGQVRREVAYLAGIQREVIVRHYLQGEKVQSIADALGVPKGTVLSRLSSGREQIRKGIETMEQYEKQSYTPERLELSCSGTPGLRDEPWSLAANDLMKQNILIIAYEKPLTVVDIAKALGIPTAYIESAVDDLVKSELMCKTGSKVFTDFKMVTPEQMLKGLDVEIEIAEKNYGSIWPEFENLFAELRMLPWYTELGEREKSILEYYAVLDVLSRGMYTAVKNIVDVTEVCPGRPDGGAWIAEGNRYPADVDFGSYRYGKYCYGGVRIAHWDSFLSSKSIELRVYDTQPDLNKYQHGPVELQDVNLCKLLYLIYRDIPFGAVGFNIMFAKDIPHLAECGVLRYDCGKPEVAIPVIGKAQYDELWQVILKHVHALGSVLEAPLRGAFPKLKIRIPKHLEGRIAEFRKYPCYALPMAIIKEAQAKGDFLKDVKYKTPPMILIIDEDETIVK